MSMHGHVHPVKLLCSETHTSRAEIQHARPVCSTANLTLSTTHTCLPRFYAQHDRTGTHRITGTALRWYLPVRFCPCNSPWSCPPLLHPPLLPPSLPQRAGVRRTAKLRQRYLTAALHQDIPYYDTTLTSGAVIAGLNTDCAAVQAATSERIGHTINNLTQFFLGLAIGFVRGWKLSLMMVAVFPVMAVAGAIVAKVATAGDAQNSKAYAAANSSAAQAIANVRTVAAFQAEQPLLALYTELLAYPRRVSIRMSVLTGFANGSINAAVFLACAPYANCAIYATFQSPDTVPEDARSARVAVATLAAVPDPAGMILGPRLSSRMSR